MSSRSARTAADATRAGGAPVANCGRPHANVHADVPLICQPAGIGNPARGRWHDALLREIEAMFRSAGLTITSSLPARIIPTGAARTDGAIAFCRTAVPSGNTSERSSTPTPPRSVPRRPSPACCTTSTSGTSSSTTLRRSAARARTTSSRPSWWGNGGNREPHLVRDVLATMPRRLHGSDGPRDCG